VIIITAKLFAIDYISVDNPKAKRMNQYQNDDKNTLFSYHNSSVDRLFYGTDSWAVFYDFTKWYAGIDTLKCQVESIYLYSWQNRVSAKIYLYDNVNGQPGSVIQERTSALTEGWNEIPVNPVELSQFWVIFDDITSNNVNAQNYVCASEGSGKNSYYKSGQAYYNFANNGFKSELLISVKGQLQSGMTDLVLSDFGFDRELVPGESVRPIIRIANISKNPVFNPYVIFEYNNPNNELAGRDSVYIGNEIAAFDTLTVDLTLFEPVTLLSTPNQYQFQANVICDQMENEMLGNNSYSQIYNVFSDTLAFITLENFLQSDKNSSNQLWTAQNDLIHEGILRLDYFPDYSDDYFQLIFSEKNAWYQNYAFPNTIIQGNQKINGFNSNTYHSQLELFLNEVSRKKTFLKLERADIDTLAGSLTVNFILKNEETRLFSNYLSDCMIQAFIVQPYHFNEKHCISVSNYLTNIKTGVTLTSNYASEQSADFSIAFDKIMLYEGNHINDASLVIQVIKKSNQEILFNHLIALPELDISTSNQHVSLNAPDIEVWPNPANPKNQLSIKSEYVSKIEIFNIKGQKINQITQGLNSVYHWDYTDQQHKQVSSGIYFLKMSYPNGQHKIKKVMLLK